MEKFKKFLIKTWWLLVLLFSPPLLVISCFAILEYGCSKIDMSAGEWSSLLTGAFGYWGTIILGVLAFWQNDQVQENNDLLMKYERSKMTPVFMASLDGFNGALADIRVNITNISDNIACTFEVSALQISNAGQIYGEYPMQNPKSFLNAHETVIIEFKTPNTIIHQGETFKYCFEIKSTDIIGHEKKTKVTMQIDAHFSPVFSYQVLDIC